MKKNLFKYFLLLICLLAAPAAHAQTVGPSFAGTAADVAATGTVAWVNPNNAKANDGVFTTFTTPTGTGLTKGHLLELTNFGFSVPVGATITGIQVVVARKQSQTGGACPTANGVGANAVCDNIVSLIDSTGTVTATNKKTGVVWGTTLATATYGNSSDLWSLSWAPSDINSANFGVAIAPTGEGFGGPSCVVGSTLVLTVNHGEVPIKDIQVGEKIWSYSTTTKQMQIDTVTAAASEPISDDKNTLYDVTTSDGRTVQATASHLFFANGDFVAAPDLKLGDKLLNSHKKTVKITKIKIEKKPGILVWNITVKNNSNFYANDELVHNGNTSIGSLDYATIAVSYTLPSSGFINGLVWFIQWLF